MRNPSDRPFRLTFPSVPVFSVQPPGYICDCEAAYQGPEESGRNVTTSVAGTDLHVHAALLLLRINPVVINFTIVTAPHAV